LLGRFRDVGLAVPVRQEPTPSASRWPRCARSPAAATPAHLGSVRIGRHLGSERTCSNPPTGMWPARNSGINWRTNVGDEHSPFVIAAGVRSIQHEQSAKSLVLGPTREASS
jgi:hypothetical protein